MAHFGVENHEHFGFVAGFLHPLGGLDHLAAMISVGLWSALSARRAGLGLLWGPAGFATLLMAGAYMGLQGMATSAMEPMIAASLLVMGLLVVSRLRVGDLAAALMVGVFAMFHGMAHGSELAARPDALQAMAGLLAATLMLHAAGLGLGWALRHTNVWVPRLAGALVAALGSVLLLQLA